MTEIKSNSDRQNKILGGKHLIKKRDGRTVEFDKQRIVTAIEKAMLETLNGVDTNLSNKIADEIYNMKDGTFTVEKVQDLVEIKLMESNRKDVAKAYIIYRNERDKNRVNKISNDEGLLSEEFISKYKHKPNPMNQLGSFVYYRTYSRWLPSQKRREYWWETVKRAVEYNCSLAPTTKEEAEQLFDNIYNTGQFLSGRTFWTGGTEVSKKYPLSNYNCAFAIIDEFETFSELFYLLLIGSGTGFRVLPDDVNKLPKVKANVKVTHESYNPIAKYKRQDNTALNFYGKNVAEIIVGDSKEGWVQALDTFFKLLYKKDYDQIDNIILNYNNVRPKGERLRTFGGRASGHESIKSMFYKIDRVLKNAYNRKPAEYIKLKTIDCMDIINIIGENVVSGGVRRTSENTLFDENDVEIAQSKNNLYTQVNGKWEEDPEISHRKMSNNSIFYTKKPTREQLHWQLEQMRYSGEPGFVNAEAASKRRENFNGLNPCFEILLDSKGVCNLTTVNVLYFVEDGVLNVNRLLQAQRLSARAGYRMSMVEFELHKWDAVNKRDRLVGCSLTGWQDMIDATNMTEEDEIELLKQLKDVAHDELEKMSQELGLNKPILITTIKPEGTLSLLPGVSPGLHYSHAQYYIRRIRVNAFDPVVQVCEELGYRVLPEVGETEENCKTKVVEFPVKSTTTKTKSDISAIKQLENYKKFMKYYVDHNASITVTVKENEWEEVEQWMWDNWDDVVAVSFLPLSDAFYQLMPYETIDKDEYEARLSEMKPFIPSLITKYENQDDDFDVEDPECASGACPIR